MAIALHQPENPSETLEVPRLCGTQRSCSHKRHDTIFEIVASPYAPSIHVFTMVVVSRISIDGSAAKELLKDLQSTNAARSLGHDELRPDLPAKPHCRTPVDVHAEAALSVDEPGDPPF